MMCALHTSFSFQEEKFYCNLQDDTMPKPILLENDELEWLIQQCFSQFFYATS